MFSGAKFDLTHRIVVPNYVKKVHMDIFCMLIFTRKIYFQKKTVPKKNILIRSLILVFLEESYHLFSGVLYWMTLSRNCTVLVCVYSSIYADDIVVTTNHLWAQYVMWCDKHYYSFQPGLQKRYFSESVKNHDSLLPKQKNLGWVSTANPWRGDTGTIKIS